MKKLQVFLFLFSIPFYGQTYLKFDKKIVESEDHWVAFPADSIGRYPFGFIYIDAQAGLTLDYSGTFKIDGNGKYIAEKIGRSGTQKVRLQPNSLLLAFIPDQKLKELEVDQIPDWLKIYKGDPESIERLYRWGYMYNGYGEIEKALTYLQKIVCEYEFLNLNHKNLDDLDTLFLLTREGWSKNHIETYHAQKQVLSKFFIATILLSDGIIGTVKRELRKLAPEIIDAHRLIINTTPLGMEPDTRTSPAIPFEQITSQHWLYDLVYNPGNTVFLTRGQQSGARTKNGLDMLHLQAEHAWSIWKLYGKF